MGRGRDCTGRGVRASLLTVIGTWLVSWRRDRRQERMAARAGAAAAVQEMLAMSLHVTLRAQHLGVLAAHYSSPRTSLGMLFGTETAADLATLVSLC